MTILLTLCSFDSRHTHSPYSPETENKNANELIYGKKAKLTLTTITK